jgi:hypothetical protein
VRLVDTDSKHPLFADPKIEVGFDFPTLGFENEPFVKSTQGHFHKTFDSGAGAPRHDQRRVFLC